MAARLLFTSAGNGSSNNLARSMRAGADVPFIVGCNDDQFALKKSDADRNYLVPPADHPEWSEVLRWIMKTERLHLIIPTVDPDVESLSRARKKLGEWERKHGGATPETEALRTQLDAMPDTDHGGRRDHDDD